MKTTIIVLLFVMSFFGKANSQELVSSSGDYFETTNSNLEWSLGETFIESFQQGSIILTQGQHQSYYSITEIEDKINLIVDIYIYPNPATEYFIINTDLTGHNYSISDLTGKTVLSGKITGKTQVTISNLKKSLYFLNITNEDKIAVKTFKIIKY